MKSIFSVVAVVLLLGSVQARAGGSVPEISPYCERVLKMRETDPALAEAIDGNYEQAVNAVVDLETLAPEHRPPGFVEKAQNLAWDQVVEWKGKVQAIYSPIRVKTERGPERLLLGYVPDMNADEALQMYKNAERAADDWRLRSAQERAERGRRFIEHLKANKAEFVTTISWEINKTYELAEAEFDRTIKFMSQTIDKMLEQEANPERYREGNREFLIKRVPVGVVINFAPYNYPFNEAIDKAFAAVMTGNTIVIKPAKYGVLLWNPFMEAAQKTLPSGVVNFIYGDGATVWSKISKEKIGGIAYTGSEFGARKILEAIPDGLHKKAMPMVAGLSTKNPVFVLKDADLDWTAAVILDGMLAYSAQRCTAPKAILVHSSLKEALLERLMKGVTFEGKFYPGVEQAKLGLPFEKGVTLTASPDWPASPSETWGEKNDRFVMDAVSKGAKIYNYGGGRGENNYYAPTLLVDVKPDMLIYHEEIFGPVIPVIEIQGPEDAVRWQQESNFHQQVGIFGEDPTEVQYIIDHLPLEGRFNWNSKNERGPDHLPFAATGDAGFGEQSLILNLQKFTRLQVHSVGIRKQNP